MSSDIESWENEEIDLNLRHYSGHPTDVIKKIKYEIEQFLSTQNATDKQREIYSAIYNALEYYTVVSYIQPADFDTEDSFLSSAIEAFNEDYSFLSQKYNSEDPTAEPVITFSARIKSPLSFMKKVKEKVNTYLEEGRDFRYFNESLRDIMGAKIVINPPDFIKASGEQAASNYLHEICYVWMNHHGINSQDQTTFIPGIYRFLSVNSRYNPGKQKQIQENAIREYSDSLTFSESEVFLPQSRMAAFDQPHIDQVAKDYAFYTKPSGYQAIHVCVIPDYSAYLEHQSLPSCIIPPASYDYYIEYQFKTEKQNEFAEHGGASHKLSYKPDEAIYHRLAVPFYIETDGPHDISDNHYNNVVPSKIVLPPRPKRLRLRNFAESFERFYGYTFEERFGISFKDFRDTFSAKERDEILALRKVVKFDPENDFYFTEEPEFLITLTEEQKRTLQERLLAPEDKAMMKVLDELGLINNSKSQDAIPPTKPKIKFVPIMSVGALKKHMIPRYRIVRHDQPSNSEPKDQHDDNNDAASLDD